MGISILGYALLVLLERQPLSGYELGQRLQKPIGFFWQAPLSQIYPELVRLEQQHYVSHELIVQEDRPSKKVYTLMETGYLALKAWITEPPAPAPVRNELFLKAYALGLADPGAAQVLFRDQARLHAERLVTLEQIQARIERDYGGAPGPEHKCFGDYITARWGATYERELVAWCRWVADIWNSH